MPHLLDSQASAARLHDLTAAIPNNPRETALPDFMLVHGLSDQLAEATQRA